MPWLYACKIAVGSGAVTGITTVVRYYCSVSSFLHGLRYRCSGLFAHFVGTTKSSDFPEATIPAVPLKSFSDHSQQPEGCREISGISRFSRLKFLGLLRFFDSAESFFFSLGINCAIRHRLPMACYDNITYNEAFALTQFGETWSPT